MFFSFTFCCFLSKSIERWSHSDCFNLVVQSLINCLFPWDFCTNTSRIISKQWHHENFDPTLPYVIMKSPIKVKNMLIVFGGNNLIRLWYLVSHRIHVWYIYLHLVVFNGKCRWIYHSHGSLMGYDCSNTEVPGGSRGLFGLNHWQGWWAWWAMVGHGFEQKPRLCCRFFLEIGFLLTPTSAFGSKRSCKFQIGFYSGDIHPSTSWDFVVDNVYRQNSVQSIKSSKTSITSILHPHHFPSIFGQIFSHVSSPYFFPTKKTDPKNWCHLPLPWSTHLTGSLACWNRLWRFDAHGGAVRKIGALVGQRFWTTPMCSLDTDMIIYIYI